MPKSRVRKKSVYTPPPTKKSPRAKVSPPWIAPTMVVSALLGLAWIVLYYLTNGGPAWMAPLGGWNLVCGFALIVVAVVLATQWR